MNNYRKFVDNKLKYVYVNLNRIIKIIRTDSDPEKKLMKTFRLNKRQAEAVLSMRLRQLKKLEEKEIKSEYKDLQIYKESFSLKSRDVGSVAGLWRQKVAKKLHFSLKVGIWAP